MKHISIYASRDIYLAAFLYAAGIPLTSYERAGGLTTFQFTQTDELSQLVQDFYADRAKISPMKYGNAFKNLKAMIYQTNSNTYGNHEYTHNTGSAL